MNSTNSAQKRKPAEIKKKVSRLNLFSTVLSLRRRADFAIILTIEI